MTGIESKALTRTHLMVSSLIGFLDPLALADCRIPAVPALGLCVGAVSYCIAFYWAIAEGKCSETNKRPTESWQGQRETVTGVG